MAVYSIYRIINLVNRMVYIGFTSQSPNRRWNQHKCDSQTKDSQFYIHRAMRKYGVECFTFEVIYQSKDRDHTHKVMESFFIDEHDSINNGYNLTPGGDGTFGRVITPEMREHLSKTLTGRKHSEEARAKISAAQTGKKLGPLSEEHRAKISSSQIGRKHSDETKAKMSASQIGKKRTDETKSKLSVAKSQSWIIVHPDGREETVSNMRDFCITHNLNAPKMTLVAQGKRSQHKGYQCRKA